MTNFKTTPHFVIVGRREADGSVTLAIAPEVIVDFSNGDMFQRVVERSGPGVVPHTASAKYVVNINGEALPTNDEIRACVYVFVDNGSVEQAIAKAFDAMDDHRDNKPGRGEQRAA